MNRKIVALKTLRNCSAADLEEDVKRYLADGWELKGPIMPVRYRNANYFLQDMVKYEEQSNEQKDC